jgi:hypothetical protein
MSVINTLRTIQAAAAEGRKPVDVTAVSQSMLRLYESSRRLMKVAEGS